MNEKVINIDEKPIDIDDLYDVDSFEDLEKEINEEKDDSENDTDFTEVIALTEYDGGLNKSRQSESLVIAAYENINPTQIQSCFEASAKNIVNRITRFVIDTSDDVLTTQHKKYLVEIGKLQMTQLADMMMLIEINRKMLNNIIERVNVTMAEDYAVVSTYISISNQHIKLHRELQTHYKSSAAIMRKMKDDVMRPKDSELGSDDDQQQEELPENQFNNQKQLITQIRDKRKAQLERDNAAS